MDEKECCAVQVFCLFSSKKASGDQYITNSSAFISERLIEPAYKNTQFLLLLLPHLLSHKNMNPAGLLNLFIWFRKIDHTMYCISKETEKSFLII